MNAGYSKSSGPDWCSVFRPPTQITWNTLDTQQTKEQSQQTQSQQSQKSQRKDRVKIIVSQDTKSPKTQ